MPNVKSALEEYEADERKLRQTALDLQQEYADKVAEQNRVYTQYIKPNAHMAKLIQAAVVKGDKPLTMKQADKLTGDDPTVLFEKGRAMAADLSRQCHAINTKLGKTRTQLEHVRTEVRRLRRSEEPGQMVLSGPLADWVRVMRQHALEVMGPT